MRTKINKQRPSLDGLAEKKNACLLENEQRAIKGGLVAKVIQEDDPIIKGGSLKEVVITASSGSGGGVGGFSFGYSGGSFGMGGFVSGGFSGGGIGGYSGYGGSGMSSGGGGGYSVGGSYSSPSPVIAKSEKEWLGPINTVNGAVGVVASAIENIPQLVSNVFKSISQIQVTNVGKAGGAVTIGLGLGLDGVGVYNYYTNGQNSPNSVSPQMAGVNLGVGAIGLLGAPGAVVGGLYFGVEKLYPGGILGAINKNGDLTKRNREILGNNWNLNRDY